MRRLLVAGTHSGSGKTTVTCAVLSALKMRGLPVTAFKCGPDFIDPMFHRSVSGIPSWNLDPFFLDRDRLVSHFLRHAGREENSIAVIEGVMGYYDGIGVSGRASTWTAAEALKTPAVLVLDTAGMGASAGAVIEGFVRHREKSGICGVIFNGIPGSAWPFYRTIAENSGVRAFGFLPKNGEWSIGSRHLGLTTAAEIPGLEKKLAALGKQALESIDIDGLLDAASSAPELRAAEKLPPAFPGERTRVAVARDEAFCFIYPENLELFAENGLECVFFSPLRDRALPDGIAGLYLPGGYPELYCRELSENAAMREAVKNAVAGGICVIAECGGFLYLHETLDGFPMTGAIPAAAYRTEKLQRFGYVTLTARKDSLLCPSGASIAAHEFHYWESAAPGDAFTGRRPERGTEYPCIHATETLYAGFPHLYLPANPAFAARFAEKCRAVSAAGEVP